MGHRDIDQKWIVEKKIKAAEKMPGTFKRRESEWESTCERRW